MESIDEMENSNQFEIEEIIEEYFDVIHPQNKIPIEEDKKEIETTSQVNTSKAQFFRSLYQLERVKIILKTEKEPLSIIEAEGIDIFKYFGTYQKNPLLLRSMYETLEMYLKSLKSFEPIEPHLKTIMTDIIDEGLKHYESIRFAIRVG